MGGGESLAATGKSAFHQSMNVLEKVKDEIQYTIYFKPTSHNKLPLICENIYVCWLSIMFVGVTTLTNYSI